MCAHQCPSMSFASYRDKHADNLPVDKPSPVARNQSKTSPDEAAPESSSSEVSFVATDGHLLRGRLWRSLPAQMPADRPIVIINAATSVRATGVQLQMKCNRPPEPSTRRAVEGENQLRAMTIGNPRGTPSAASRPQQKKRTIHLLQIRTGLKTRDRRLKTKKPGYTGLSGG